MTELPTKPDQVAEAESLESKLISSLQLHQNQRENKIKKSKLAYLLNYDKAAIIYLTLSVQYCQMSVMLDSGCLLC